MFGCIIGCISSGKKSSLSRRKGSSSSLCSVAVLAVLGALNIYSASTLAKGYIELFSII